MVRRMIAENDEWRHDASTDVEMMRTILEAFAAGKIKLPPLPPKTHTSMIRYADDQSSTHGDHRWREPPDDRRTLPSPAWLAEP
jgi:hypothetical protein